MFDSQHCWVLGGRVNPVWENLTKWNVQMVTLVPVCGYAYLQAPFQSGGPSTSGWLFPYQMALLDAVAPGHQPSQFTLVPHLRSSSASSLAACVPPPSSFCVFECMALLAAFAFGRPRPSPLP